MATVFAAASALKENGGFSNSDFVYGAQTPKVGEHNEAWLDFFAAVYYGLIAICIGCPLVCILIWLWPMATDGDGEPAKAKLQRYLGGVSGQASNKKLGASKDGDDSVVVILV